MPPIATAQASRTCSRPASNTPVSLRYTNRYSRNLIDEAKPREIGLACASNERLAKRTVRVCIMMALADRDGGSITTTIRFKQTYAPRFCRESVSHTRRPCVTGSLENRGQEQRGTSVGQAARDGE